ncbi:major facilitator superfamily transporter [Purpureocillium lavendulum]|uniref:Major facilitator superfamily transporter n=1 Tax=Purpureocillium lavendulum TaxID=1247861 RepID=A0AB34G1K3_9HYPO|nr:major facilitator superfamily transporter [Purpureocillium lavendulum]
MRVFILLGVPSLKQPSKQQHPMRSTRETAPLLGAQQQQRPQHADGLGRASRFQARRPRTIVALLAFMLLEDSVCRRYYERGAGERALADAGGVIDEKMCKVGPVQSKVAYLNGWQAMIEAVVGLCVAFPYGALADKIGRKPIILLSFVSYTLSGGWTACVLALDRVIPVELVLLSPAFFFIGGGTCVVVSALYSAVSDVTDDETRANSFLMISFGGLIGAFVGPVVSSALMQLTSPWVPLLASFAALLLGGAVMAFVPETMPPRKADPEDESPMVDTTGAMFRRHLRHSTAQLKESLDILRQPALVIILVCFLSPVPNAIGVSQLFAQYVSKRFDWTLASAGYLLSVRGTVNLLVLLVVIPGLSRVLLSRRVFRGGLVSVAGKNRLLAQLSAVGMTLGCLLMAGSSVTVVVGGLVINTLGAGLPPLARALAANFVDSHNTSKLQTLIGITETVSSMFAGPALAGLFSAGMADGGGGGAWMGLPYVCLAGFLALTTAPLFFLRIPTSDCVEAQSVSE